MVITLVSRKRAIAVVSGRHALDAGKSPVVEVDLS